MFDRHAFIDLFTSAGLVDVGQQTQRTLQFVTAGKPGPMTSRSGHRIETFFGRLRVDGPAERPWHGI